MNIYACSRLKTFFIEGIHVEIPEDAEAISPELHGVLLDGQSACQEINFSTSPPSLMERTNASNTSAERAWRNFELQGTEWLIARHRDEQDMGRETTLTEPHFTELLTFRQALRDWPQSEPFPDARQRPVAPSWVAEQL